MNTKTMHMLEEDFQKNVHENCTFPLPRPPVLSSVIVGTPDIRRKEIDKTATAPSQHIG